MALISIGQSEERDMERKPGAMCHLDMNLATYRLHLGLELCKNG